MEPHEPTHKIVGTLQEQARGVNPNMALEYHQMPTLETQGALAQEHAVEPYRACASHTKLSSVNTYLMPVHKMWSN